MLTRHTHTHQPNPFCICMPRVNYHNFMKDGSGVIVHLVKLINTTDPIVAQYQCSTGERETTRELTDWHRGKERKD